MHKKITDMGAHIESRIERVPFSGCWIWMGGISPDGYSNGMYRKSYLHFRGEIPKGLHLDHLCRVRCCVNPWHLEAVTCHENILRGVGATAINARKTHCKYGHEFTPENTEIVARGRHCRQCKNERRRVAWMREHKDPNFRYVHRKWPKKNQGGTKP